MSDELSDHHTMLVWDLEGSAQWRREKAEEYPDDGRNQQSADALSRAARDVAALAGDDPRLEHLWDFYGMDDDALGMYGEEANRIIGRHGFGPGGTQTTDELLAALVNAADEATVNSLDYRLELQDDETGGSQESN